MSKDKILNFKIEEDAKAEFEEICKAEFVSPSQVLRLYVRQYIKQNKGSRIALSNLRANRK